MRENRPRRPQALRVNLIILAFYLPPVFAATNLIWRLARHLGWSDGVMLATSLVMTTIAIVLWTAGFVVWSRRRVVARGPHRGDRRAG